MDIYIIHANNPQTTQPIALQVAGSMTGCGHRVVRSDEEELGRLGDNAFTSFVEGSQHLLGAVIILTGKETPSERESLIVKYAVLAGKLGTKRAILCQLNDADIPEGLQGLITIEWKSDNTANPTRQIQRWLAGLNEHKGAPEEPIELNEHERIVLREMYGRMDEFGYVTLSYVQTLLKQEANRGGKAKATLSMLQRKKLIHEHLIRKLNTYFLTDLGISKAIELSNASDTVDELSLAQEEFEPQRSSLV